MKNVASITALVLLALIVQNSFAGSATWKSHPSSSDWNNAANWKPRTVPNGPGDTATFAVSDITNVRLPLRQMELNGIVFNPGASPFNVSVNYTGALVLSGVGIANNSGIEQNFTVTDNYYPGLMFNNQSTAGAQTSFTVGPNLGQVDFYDEATAGSATFTIVGTEYFEDGAAGLSFYDDSTAANAVITNTGGSGEDSQGGSTYFTDDSTAANANITNKAVTDPSAYTGGATDFSGNATAADAVITNEGGDSSMGYFPGYTSFWGSATAANAIITCIGGTAGGGPATLDFHQTSTAANATLIATGGSDGSDGGIIRFWDTADGGTARVALFGNGTLDLSGLPDFVTPNIGSLEGDGIVSLGSSAIFLNVGTNNLSTVFSGLIEGKGVLGKSGSGTLTLTGPSTYSGDTEVLGGFLKVSNATGSATGTGTVVIFTSGAIGGSGSVGGALIVNSGGTLAPGTGTSTLTVKKEVDFVGASYYVWRVKTTSIKADKVVAGQVQIESGAFFSGIAVGHATPDTGTTFTAIRNTSSIPISGTFSNLPDAGTIKVGNNTFQANYEGGDGNDLTLTVISN